MRHQKGSIVLRSGSFYCRAYVGGKQKNFLLVRKDDKHHSAKCRPVQLLKDECMAKINCLADQAAVITGQQYWDSTFLPVVEKHMKPSTQKSYKQIWRQFLKDELGSVQLRDYTVQMGRKFLTALAERGLGRRTIAHIRALMSSIFREAINDGLVESSPIHDIKVRGIRAPKDTDHYTLEEVENAISALKEHVDCQLVFALGFYQGLRPSEIQGLQVGDFSDDFVMVRRAVVAGKLGTTKTVDSATDVPLTEMTKVFLALHLAKNQPQKWLFESENGSPAILNNLVNRVIKPVLGDSYKSLYCLRRGGATALVEMSGNLVGAQGLLRHKSMTTTAMFYKKSTPLETIRQVKLLEAKAQK
jgi:integrase